MKPTDKIKNWLSTIEDEAHKEIAFFVLQFAEGREDSWSENAVQLLEEWLTIEPDTSLTTVGRAVTFREAIKFSLERRGSDDNWEFPKGLFEDVLREGKEDPGSTAASMSDFAQKSLDDMPRRTEMWKKVIASWNKFSGEELSDEALKTWHEKQMFKR